MIPRKMEAFLRARLPERTFANRLQCQDGRCYMEFSAVDVDRLGRLGIEADALGPHLVVCMWDDSTPLEVGGYLVVDNLAMGRPAMGGIRMLADITPSEVHSRARGMTLKNAAADLPFGGGKVGIVAERSLTRDEHNEVVRRFAHLLARYKALFLPGPDVGTNDADMKIIAIETGLDTVISKPAEMGGSRVDQLGAAAGGMVIALRALLDELPRLKALPQFAGLKVPTPDELTVLIQGFGAVGANTARLLWERLPGSKVVGVSDALGCLYDPDGLPVDHLYEMREEMISVTRPYFQEVLLNDRWGVSRTKYASAPNDLLRESAFCMIPASPVANYLDMDESSGPSVTVDRMGRWSVIIEGANTYSPDRAHKQARMRLEREVYRSRGVLIATDYLVNSGGVIFAAQEQLIKTPGHLRIPSEMLGDRAAVERWLAEHAAELGELAEKRRHAAEAYREEVICRNMHELVSLLVEHPDMLPYEAAEHISVERVTRSESDRTAAQVMAPMETIPVNGTLKQAAERLVGSGQPILAVVAPDGELQGVVTEWDITRAVAQGIEDRATLEQVMSTPAITVDPGETLLSVMRKLEHHEISAMPVVENGAVIGLISADLLDCAR
ncbi:MAG: Glu/Leu/Phe/Val dehydrogenase dimerization domain-containing protein [Chloroflexota bacterium]